MAPYAFVWEKVETTNFSETIIEFVIKFASVGNNDPPWVAVHLSTFSNILFSEATRLIEAKLHMEPPWVRGMKACSRGHGHMTLMAARPIYGKNTLKFFFSGTNGQMPWDLVCSIGDMVLP